MKRFVAATAALWVLATTLWVPAPAAAAPADRPCTPKEAVDPNPLVKAKCIQRIKDSGVQILTCTQAPPPDDPASGMAGMVSARTAADLRSGITDRATQYGVAGYRLSTYGQGCAAQVTQPVGNLKTEVADAEFWLAAAIIGSGDTLRERAYTPGSTWGFMDGLLTGVVDKTFRWVFGPWGIVTLIVTGLWLMWRAHRANLSESLHTIGWALTVAALTTAVYFWAPWIAHTADQLGAQGIDVAHSATGQPPESVPADRCISPDLDACVDHRTPAGRAAAKTVDAILYRNWLRAELGSADSQTAQTYGPLLYDAQTLTWGESANMASDPAMRKTIVDMKADRWHTVAAQVKAEDPVAYEHLQGSHGMDRVAAGAVALVSAVFFSAFDVLASIVILFGFLVVRLALMALPVLGAFGMFRPASGMFRSAVNAAVGALWNVIVFAALSGLYLSATAVVLSSALPFPVQLAAMPLAGGLCLWLRRPVSRVRDVARLRKPARVEPEAVAS